MKFGAAVIFCARVGASEKTCSDYFGDVSGLVTVVDTAVGIPGKTDGSGAYCDANNVSRPCSFIHYAGLTTQCGNPAPPDAAHRYQKVTYSHKCREVLRGMNLTWQVDVDRVFDSRGVLKRCADYVISVDTTCWAPPAEDPQQVACDDLTQALHEPELAQDSSLFIGPFYKVNEQEFKAAPRFRQAYCEARRIADTESFTHLFNTVVTSQPRSGAGSYFTREEFVDGNAFNWHIENVSEAFTNALGVASPTGFSALGTQADLDAIAGFTEKEKVMTFVKDSRSFKRRQFTGEHYFALDFFLTLNATDLPFFEKSWGETRDFAATFPDILAFAMGVHMASDGTVTVHCQETYANVQAYEEWLPRASKYADAFFSVSTLATHPNPFAMTGTTTELERVKDHCQELGCVQYFFDDCVNISGVGEVLV